MVTMAERLDAIYPRVAKALAWGVARYGIADYFATDDETRGAEALFNARLNDYAQGGEEEGVKSALERLIKAHARKAV